MFHRSHLRFLAPTAVAMVTLLAFATPASANTGSSTVSFTSGGYALLSPVTIAFGGVALNGTTQTLSTSTTAALDFNDASGSNAGWNLTAQETTVFTNGGSTLPNATIALASRGTLTCDATAAGCSVGTVALSTPVVYPVTVATGSATKVFQAAAGSGMGSQGSGTAQTWNLGGTIPANTQAISYTATITYTMASGI